MLSRKALSLVSKKAGSRVSGATATTIPQIRTSPKRNQRRTKDEPKTNQRDEPKRRTKEKTRKTERKRKQGENRQKRRTADNKGNNNESDTG